MLIQLIDGAMGTALTQRGVALPAPGWSAHAVAYHPQVIREIHAAYAHSGASVHTATTFRTTERAWGKGWRQLARTAVRLAQDSVPTEHLIAGSIAPLEDCYRPDLSPPRTRQEHRRLCEVLADAGCDLLLCETFAHPHEALVAVEEAVGTGLPTWLSLTAGFSASLMSPDDVRTCARNAVERGVGAILVNCIPHDKTLPFVQAISGHGVPFGAYANLVDAPGQTTDLVAHASTWNDIGATLIGGCCGTGPTEMSALYRHFMRTLK